VQKIDYGGWPNCIKLSNGIIELVATTDVGPRIIRFGFSGGDNEFFEDPSQMGKTGATTWMGYGGHRFWLAPEKNPRTYYADNFPVRYEMDGNTLRLIPDVELTTRVQKQIEITLHPDSNQVELVHRATNHNLWGIELAPWALSVMRSGGKAIIPQEPYSPHPAIPDEPGQVIDQRFYLPVRNLVLWSYTKLNDPRFAFLENYILLNQDPNAKRPQKVGVSNEVGWVAYARNGHLFVKTFTYEPDAVYPDNGCNVETFTNADMLELETLGPLVRLAPGESATLKEDWYLFDNVSFDDSDESIDANVLPKVLSVIK
jgi:hypothetical protein